MNVQRLTTVALLVATQIVLARFCSIQLFMGSTPVARIGFGFLPLVLVAVLYGPFYAGIAGVVADVVGYMFSPAGAFFPGFTFTAFVTGAIYGLFLYRKPRGIVRISVMMVTVSLLCSLALNTLWLTVLTGRGFLVIMQARIVQEAIHLPVSVLCTFAVGNAPQLRKFIPAHNKT